MALQLGAFLSRVMLILSHRVWLRQAAVRQGKSATLSQAKKGGRIHCVRSDKLAVAPSPAGSTGNHALLGLQKPVQFLSRAHSF